jgi:hypothetical protein
MRIRRFSRYFLQPSQEAHHRWALILRLAKLCLAWGALFAASLRSSSLSATEIAWLCACVCITSYAGRSSATLRPRRLPVRFRRALVVARSRLRSMEAVR